MEAKDFERQLKAEQKRYSNLQTRALIERSLLAEADRFGIVYGAIPDIAARAIRSGEWQVNSVGELVRMRDGKPDIRPGGDPVTPAEWLVSVKKSVPYFFRDAYPQAHQDSQQDSRSGQQQQGGQNPWTRENWNLTAQSAVVARSRAEAERLAAAAGSSLNASSPPEAKAGA